MPPKTKFTREQIVAAALEIVGAEGTSALTARSLSARLGCSVCPIFTVFQNMEEVQAEVLAAAKLEYARYVRRGLAEAVPFRGVGEQYVRFAVEQPKLFQLLFMSETGVRDVNGLLPAIDENYDAILDSVSSCYGLEEEDAKKLYRHLWVYTHGIATMCATRVYLFGGEEIAEALTEVFTSLLKQIKTKQIKEKK